MAGLPLWEKYDGGMASQGFMNSFVACYEGLCLGPLNRDGSFCLMMVSDGGAMRTQPMKFFTVSALTRAYVRTLQLHGFDVLSPEVGRAREKVPFPVTERPPTLLFESIGSRPRDLHRPESRVTPSERGLNFSF